MKTKIIIIFSLLLVSSIICNSQTTDSLSIEKDSICIGVDFSKMFYCLFYEIENKCNDVFYLWIEKEIHSSDQEKIRDYIMRDKTKIEGSMSVYQMAMETEITFGCRAIFGNFLKKIKPMETFTIQILSAKELSEHKKNEIFKYLDEHVVTVNENILRQYVVGLESFNSLLFYKYNFITIPVNILDI